jgi:hypothetical protein
VAVADLERLTDRPSRLPLRDLKRAETNARERLAEIQLRERRTETQLRDPPAVVEPDRGNRARAYLCRVGASSGVMLLSWLFVHVVGGPCAGCRNGWCARVPGLISVLDLVWVGDMIGDGVFA